MAWLQNLAEKAEDLLNIFDQNAANVLNDSNHEVADNILNLGTLIIDDKSQSSALELDDLIKIDDLHDEWSSTADSEISIDSKKTNMLVNASQNTYLAASETFEKSGFLPKWNGHSQSNVDMAWLQNLAGKAEDLLIKFDQNAANVLNDSNQKVADNSLNLGTLLIDDKSQSSASELDNLIEIDDDLHDEWNSTANSENSINENSKIVSVMTSSPNGSQNTYLPVSGTFEKSGFSPKWNGHSQNFYTIDDIVNNYEDKISKLEKEKQELNEFTLSLRHLYSELQNENSNLQSQFDRINDNLMITQNEMEEYRARAQRILHEKQKCIESKEESQSGSNNEVQLLSSNINEFKKKLQFSEKKYEELTAKFLKCSNELSTVQRNLVTAQRESYSAVNHLRDSLSNERKLKTVLEEECFMKTKELQTFQKEIVQLQNILEDKSREILKLNQQLTQKTKLPINDNLENRLLTLTQTLMSKQNTLEAVTTERNALCLQLEKLEGEYQKFVQSSRKQVKIPIENEPYEVRSQVPQFLKISPFDAPVTRQVKHAYSSLDAVSVRTGVFLRRYPVARVFVFCYMILLHVWVLIILCTDVPSSNAGKLN